MYLDYILFAVSGMLLLAAAILAVVLLRGRKRSREYRRALRQETERIDVVETLRNTQRSTASTDPDSSVPQPSTQLVTEPEAPTELAAEGETSVGRDLDLSALEGKYELLRELHGGGMSRIFLARHRTLGNEWIVKFVDGRDAELANEAEVLKKLNHISLPQIIDIFQSPQGTFLVERYIEGCSLEQALALGQSIKESLICDWGLQLAQVLRYLHSLDTPIIHCDLKPSNIMVTHDNRLVLIDFGISKRQGITDRAIGLTYRYAAPEQFHGKAASSEMAQKRFGTLPPEAGGWPIDQRTDIFSTGVILYELVMGDIPTQQTRKAVYDRATSRLADVICQCLELDPARRFQSAKDLAAALEKLKGHQLTMARSLTMRRVATVCCAASLLAGLGTSASAAYINQQENLSVVSLAPCRAVVTAQQSVQVLIEKTSPDGETVTLDPSSIQWSYSADGIARLDGDRLLGLNTGDTVLYGKYRNKVFALDVTVTEPVVEAVSTALGYTEGAAVSHWSGSGEREHMDGEISACSYVSPEKLKADGNVLYLSDSGVIRILKDGQVSTLELNPAFLTADAVCGRDGVIYVLTGPWEAEDGESYYGFVRITDSAAEFLYYTEAVWSVVTDFALSPDGLICFIQQNLGTGSTTLQYLNPDTLESGWIMDLPDGTRGMAYDARGSLYLSVPEAGVILRAEPGAESWRYWAGVENDRHFIDGAIPQFYRPTALAADGSYLYVLDFDTVRRVPLEGAMYAETVAGIPTADTNPAVTLGAGMESVLPASELASLAITRDGLLLTDPKNSAIYQITCPQ